MALPDEYAAYETARPETQRLIEIQLKRQYVLQRAPYILNFAGLVSAFIITLSFLGVSAWLIHGGFGVYGTILGSIDLVALVTVFVTANRRPPLE